jgi:hypothetical protein
MNTLTFSITVPQVVDTHTVDLPYFCKYGSSHWAILAEDHIIEVNFYTTIKSANIFKKEKLPSEIERFEVEPITREAFLNIYNQSIALITENL